MERSAWIWRMAGVIGARVAMRWLAFLTRIRDRSSSSLPVDKRALKTDARDVAISLASGALIFVVTGFPCGFGAEWVIEDTSGDDPDSGVNPN